jgi:hypothetical protein
MRNQYFLDTVKIGIQGQKVKVSCSKLFSPIIRSKERDKLRKLNNDLEGKHSNLAATSLSLSQLQVQ